MNLQINFIIIVGVVLFSGNLKTSAQAPSWEWVNAMSGKVSERCNAISVDPDGSREVYVAGSFSDTIDFDPSGETFNVSAFGNEDGFISKFDSSGNFIWIKTIGAPGEARHSFMVVDHNGDGAIYTAGLFWGTVDFDPGEDSFKLSTTGSTAIFINKLDSSGNLIWAKAIGGEKGFGSCQAMTLDTSGSRDIYLTGNFNRTMDFDPGIDTFNLTSSGVTDIFIAKLDSSGSFVWAQAIGSSSYDEGRSIAKDPSGRNEIYVTGTFERTADFDPGPEVFNLSSAGKKDIFILKLTGDGNLKWAKRIGGSMNDFGECLIIDPAEGGNVIITGSFQETTDFDPGVEEYELNASDCQQTFLYCATLFILKLDGLGNFGWANVIGGEGYINHSRIFLSPTDNRHLYITGVFGGTIDFDSGPGIFELTSAGNLWSTDCGDIFISELDDSGNFIWIKSVIGDKYDEGISLEVDHLNQVYLSGRFTSKTISFDAYNFINDDIDATNDMFFGKLAPFTVSIDEEVKKYSFKTYPNPAKDHLIFEFDDGEFIQIEINIFNVLGEIVFSSREENISKVKTINISTLATGIYFVELKINGNKTLTKVVKA